MMAKRYGVKILLLLCIGLCFANLNSLIAQGHPGMIVVLSGQVLELEEQEPIPQFPLQIDQVRPFTTDDHGFFKVPVPYASGVVAVKLRHPRYEILSPPDGSKVLSANLTPNSTVNLEIWVLGADASDELKNQLKEAQDQVAALRKKSQVTARQLEHLNQTLLDSIRVFNAQRKAFVKQVEDLEEQIVDQEERETGLLEEITNLKTQMATLERTNQSLVTRLTSALEERYLRQKEVHENITKSLLNYTSRLKDFRDQLERVGFVFRSAEAGKYFNQSIENYSEGRNEINQKRESQLEAVAHYWEKETLTDLYGQLTHFILNEIHDMEILPLNNTVLLQIQEAHLGKRVKVKKVEKTATESVARLDEKISILEERLDDFLSQLREY